MSDSTERTYLDPPAEAQDNYRQLLQEGRSVEQLATNADTMGDPATAAWLRKQKALEKSKTEREEGNVGDSAVDPVPPLDVPQDRHAPGKSTAAKK